MAKKKNKYENVPLKEQIKPIFKKRFIEMFSHVEHTRTKQSEVSSMQGEKKYENFEKIILTPQRKSFRINTLKEKNPEKLIKDLTKKGIQTTKMPWMENAYFVKFDPETRCDLGNLYEHFLGKIYIQEATSMLPPLVLDIPKKIETDFKVLDMAASPGSKTTQIGEMMKNQGTLIANELDWKRLGPLQINIERSGLSNIVITNSDGNQIKGEEIFDRILLDAPCSGSGVIRKSPKTIKTYNPKKLKSISNLQLKLLQRAFELLKKEGIMTYSTCSLDPEENEMVIEKFLENNPTAKLEKIQLKGLIQNNKLTKFFDHEIPKEITQKTIRVWPQDNDTNGFYICKIKKSNK